MRSLVFLFAIYTLLGVMGVIGFFLVLWRRSWTRWWMRIYVAITCFLAHKLIGISVEVRGTPPAHSAIIAAKHQSLLDVLLIFRSVPEPRFVMKRSLLLTPVFGLFAWRSGGVPVDRRPKHGGTETLVKAFADAQGQISIYPQGTRVPPGEKLPYRRGVLRVAEATGLPVIPVATNTGLFWSKSGRMRGPGTAVVSFLDPIPEDLPRDQLMEQLETVIEAATDALIVEGQASLDR